MNAITRFEDLIAWQKARLLTKSVYQITKQSDFSRDYGLAQQMQRAAVSIMSNIAEGFERKSTNEYHRFLEIAKASCAELRSQCYVALDVGYIEKVTFQELSELAEEVSRILAGLMAVLARKREY
jgi:four helix bundle protein